MEFRIKGTNEIVELKVYDKNGVEWTRDLIGGSGALGDYIHWDENDEIYVISQDDYDWWVNYIKEYEEGEGEFKKLKRDLHQKYDWEQVNDILSTEYYSQLGNDDYNSHANERRMAIEEIRRIYLSF